jgi:hypothetical protein
MSAPARDGLLKRHNEVRGALTFFLRSWYKHKQAGTHADPGSVLLDYARFKGLGPVLTQLRTEAPQVQRASAKPGREG